MSDLSNASDDELLARWICYKLQPSYNHQLMVKLYEALQQFKLLPRSEVMRSLESHLGMGHG